MNSLDDLRRTLDDHASQGPDRLEPAALRGRITRARRRRDVIQGGFAVMAVASVVGLSALPVLLDGDGEGNQSASSVLAQDAPRTKTVLGLTYERSGTEHSDGTRVVVTPAWDDSGSDLTAPPVLSWTTQRPDSEVEVRDAEGTVVWSSATAGFADHVALDDIAYGPVTVTSQTPGLAVAQYTFDPDGPVEGHSERGVVFPERIGGQRLVAADVSAPGETAVEVSSAGLPAGTPVTVSYLCTSPSDEVALAVSWPGEQPPVSSCDSRTGVVRSTTVGWDGSTLLAGGTLRATAVRSAQDRTQLSSNSFAQGRIAVAIYTATETVTFSDLEHPRELDLRGHRWTLEVEDGGASSKGVPLPLDPARRWMVAGAASSLLDQPDGVMDDHPIAFTFDGAPQPNPPAPRNTARTTSLPPTLAPLGVTRGELVPVDDQEADSAAVWAWAQQD